MTITYTAQVATCRHLGCFWKLLFRWKGSIYKLLWVNMLLYILLYTLLKLSSVYLMNKEQNEILKNISEYCYKNHEAIPLSFLLGFYVAIVLVRWWDQYQSIPWPDNLAVLVSVLVTGQDVRGRAMRRTIMRYANLSLVMTFTMISPFVKRRFPSHQSFVDAGLLLPSEHQRFKELEKRTIHPKHWVPLVWAIAIVARARREGKIVDDFSKETLIERINGFRGSCGALLNYDWISIPLVYPQVVSWAVYTYFLFTIVSYQYPLHEHVIKKTSIFMSIPIFPMLQFFFYMGWLLVAETLANPFGEDDDDFDISWLIDRNLQISYFIVDEMYNYHPELSKDYYWDDVLPPDSTWNPHTDPLDDPQETEQYHKDVSSQGNDTKKSGKWAVISSEVPGGLVSRSLDFGSERVIRVYLPPSLSKLTFGSVLSKGSRPNNDIASDHMIILREAETGDNISACEAGRIETVESQVIPLRAIEEELLGAAQVSYAQRSPHKQMEENFEKMYLMKSSAEQVSLPAIFPGGGRLTTGSTGSDTDVTFNIDMTNNSLNVSGVNDSTIVIDTNPINAVAASYRTERSGSSLLKVIADESDRRLLKVLEGSRSVGDGRISIGTLSSQSGLDDSEISADEAYREKLLATLSLPVQFLQSNRVGSLHEQNSGQDLPYEELNGADQTKQSLHHDRPQDLVMQRIYDEAYENPSELSLGVEDVEAVRERERTDPGPSLEPIFTLQETTLIQRSYLEPRYGTSVYRIEPDHKTLGFTYENEIIDYKQINRRVWDESKAPDRDDGNPTPSEYPRIGMDEPREKFVVEIEPTSVIVKRSNDEYRDSNQVKTEKKSVSFNPVLLDSTDPVYFVNVDEVVTPHDNPLPSNGVPFRNKHDEPSPITAIKQDGILSNDQYFNDREKIWDRFKSDKRRESEKSDVGEDPERAGPSDTGADSECGQRSTVSEDPEQAGPSDISADEECTEFHTKIREMLYFKCDTAPPSQLKLKLAQIKLSLPTIVEDSDEDACTE